MLLKEAFLYANESLAGYVENPSAEARLILQHILCIDAAQLLVQTNSLHLSAKEIAKLQQYIAERRDKKPLAYILAYKDFWNSKFTVNTDVLIPRADTETLIEAVLESFTDRNASLKFLDIGTGSGNIILSLLQEYPNASAIALDISENALEVAKRNAINLGLQNRVKFMVSNIFSNLNDEHKFDIIVSNPPYIDIADPDVEPDVRNFEPKLALFAENNGLFFYKEILKNAKQHMCKNAKIFFEVGFKQSDSVVEIAKSLGYHYVKKIKDLNKIERVIVLNKTI